MAMTGAGLKAAREEARDAVTAIYTQGSSAEAVITLSDALLLADSTAIVDYIKANAIVTTTSGAPDGEHTGNIT
jgi:hypothetical protein